GSVAGWDASGAARLDRARRPAVWVLPIRHDHECGGVAERAPQPDRCGDRRRDDQCVPLQHLPPRPPGSPASRFQDAGGGEGAMRSNNGLTTLSRRDLLSGTAAATGALVVGFWMPPRAAAQGSNQGFNPEGATWAVEPSVKEVNAWVVVSPDDTVTIRIAQTELGQGV